MPKGVVSVAFAVIAGLLGAACSTTATAEDFDYAKVKTGQLRGKLIVQWIEPDLFLFIPDKSEPLTFTRSSGEKFTPGRMLTDGGSIPRPIWILRNYSPWGFAPAFIVHDWIFTIKQCNLAGAAGHSLGGAADVMAEVMKTMIETKRIEASPLTVSAMHQAVTSPIASEAWNKGKCNPPPKGMAPSDLIQQYEISF